MPITGSGEISLIADIEAEFDQTGDTDISLFQARDDAGLTAGEVSMTDFYGLSDSVAPSVSTSSATSVTYNSMRANGNVSSDGGATITSRGFYFGTSSNYASNTKYTVSGTTGSFNRTFSSISSSTTYYITAFAINSAGESRGSTVSQATSANLNLGRTTSMAANNQSRSLYYATSPATFGGTIGTGTTCLRNSRSFRNSATSGSGEFYLRSDSSGCQSGSAYSYSSLSGYKESFTGVLIFWGGQSAAWNASGG